ncbi:hypothetical protein KC19_6G023600 [Ceratodon purpureus]|uniref:Magnesium-dependent phosphatase 1 n=1 Tax=Ceratodon purpureus TaxID=3225 RepID=A0A8T0HB49_CERPU|nr:hypothetical protein KC19_6G023600 [Ceratodon purpureus]
MHCFIRPNFQLTPSFHRTAFSSCPGSRDSLGFVPDRRRGLIGERTMPRAGKRMKNEDEVAEEALRLLNGSSNLPRLVVFDLDYTLWPFWCECRSSKENPSLYPEAKGVLDALRQKGVTMAVASRTPTPDIARCFLNKLNITDYFVNMQIYPSWSHKVEHFQKILQSTDIPYKDMLFFDDEDRNIRSVSQLGATSILVNDGVNLRALAQGLQQHGRPSASS